MIKIILTSWTLWRWSIGGFCDLTSVGVSPHWLPAWLLSSTLPLAWRPDLYRFSNVICVFKVILRGQTLVDWGGSTDSRLVWFFVSGCMYFACALKLLPTKIMSFVHAYQYMQYKASSSSCNSHKKYSRRLHIPRVQLVSLACHQEQPMKNKIHKNQ